jgi:hypothetical protein
MTANSSKPETLYNYIVIQSLGGGKLIALDHTACFRT